MEIQVDAELYPQLHALFQTSASMPADTEAEDLLRRACAVLTQLFRTVGWTSKSAHTNAAHLNFVLHTHPQINAGHTPTNTTHINSMHINHINAAHTNAAHINYVHINHTNTAHINAAHINSVHINCSHSYTPQFKYHSCTPFQSIN